MIGSRRRGSAGGQLSTGHRSERTSIRRREARADRVIAATAARCHRSGRGLVLTDRLADKLGLKRGDARGGAGTAGRAVPAAGGATVREMMGLNAYLRARR